MKWMLSLCVLKSPQNSRFGVQKTNLVEILTKVLGGSHISIDKYLVNSPFNVTLHKEQIPNAMARKIARFLLFV